MTDLKREDYEPCLRSPDPSERCMLPYKHEGPCRFEGDLKREDVARVLAELHAIGLRKKDEFDGRMTRAWYDGYLSSCEAAADRFDLRPEFESALKALEKEQDRG